MFWFAQKDGYDELASRVVAEVDRALERAGPTGARAVFNIRRQQLARMNPRHFGCVNRTAGKATAFAGAFAALSALAR